jgi:hypothetical protein
MAANATAQWNHAAPRGHTQYENDNPRARSTSRGGNYTHQDSNHAYGSLSKRPSTANMRGDHEGQQSRNNSIPRKRSTKPLRQQQMPTEEPDEGWIHRDKLREIEIQEMEQAGMRIRQPRRSGSTGPGARSTSRSMSRTGLRRPMSRERIGDSPVDDTGYGEFKRKRVSTIPAADASEEQEAEIHHQNSSELRTLEELAAPQPGFRQHSGRPSTSRIPVSKASPVPVPHEMVDRDSPLPRSRHGSTNWGGSGNWEDMQYAKRARGGSVGSQVLLDDDGYRTPSRPASSHVRASTDDRGRASHSPPKARVPNKETPTSGARKTSGPRPPTTNANKPRVRSGTSGLRPASSSGTKNPINRPEGEAPWLASMYKPDPRLPPEEQMLPTHAKRLAQGADIKNIVDTHDGTYSPVYDPHQPTLQQPTFEQQERLSARSGSPTKSAKSQDGSPWPLTGDATNEPTSPRPGTSGGYRITPTIATTRPTLQKTHTSEKDGTTPHNPTPRVPDFDKDEDEPPKKGCMGCVVM